MALLWFVFLIFLAQNEHIYKVVVQRTVYSENELISRLTKNTNSITKQTQKINSKPFTGLGKTVNK
jgi:hypothetical protein